MAAQVIRGAKIPPEMDKNNSKIWQAEEVFIELV